MEGHGEVGIHLELPMHPKKLELEKVLDLSFLLLADGSLPSFLFPMRRHSQFPRLLILHRAPHFLVALLEATRVVVLVLVLPPLHPAVLALRFVVVVVVVVVVLVLSLLEDALLVERFGQTPLMLRPARSRSCSRKSNPSCALLV